MANKCCKSHVKFQRSLSDATETREHPGEVDEVEPAVAAAGGVGDAAAEENFEHSAALQQTAHGDGEETGTVGGGFTAGAFGDV